MITMKILLAILILFTIVGAAGAMVSVLVSSLPMTLLFAFFGGMSGLGAHSIYGAMI